MAIDFPASPSTNDIHQVGSQIWFWNGTYWELKSNVTKFLSQDAAPSSPIAGDIWYETDTGKLFIRYDSYWVEIGHASDGQVFIVSETTPASTTTGDIWYESDTGKTFIYYDSYWVEIGHASDADVSAYAPLASPELTGAPLAPTAAADTNTTQIATTQYVQTELGALSSDSITDADANTKIQVEESSDENIIRFDTAGTERMTISAAGVVATVGDLTVGGNATIQSLDMDDIVAGDVIYGSGADTLARLAKGSNDEVLTLASGIPSWAAIPAAASDEIVDADNDTKIQVEESADEDKIRFDTGGTERMVIDNSTSPAVRLPNATTSGVHFNMGINGASPAADRFYGIGFDAESNQDRYKVAVGVEGNGGYSYGKFHILNKPDHDSGNPADLTDAVLTAHANGVIELPKSGGGLKLDNLESDDVNVLDDYEEGTFTGSFSVQNGTVTISSSYNTGGYTKIGRMVHIQFSAAVDSFSGNSGQLYIEGMPFTSMPVGVSTSLTYSRLPVSVSNLNADVGQGAFGQLPHNYTQVSVSASDCCSSNRPIGGDLKQYTEVCINGSYYVDS